MNDAAFIESIGEYVRVELAKFLAERNGNHCSTLGMVLTREAQADRDEFEQWYGGLVACTMLLLYTSGQLSKSRSR